MASTFHGLELGKRGLYAQQTALSTTGHNIANANTAGYTRQRAEMQATNAMPYPGLHGDRSPAQLGTGVEVTQLVRLREDYLDVQYRGENKNAGYWEAKSDTLTKLEELFNEPSDTGLAHVMDEFWKGWQELAKTPESAATRSVIRQKGVAVAETFNHMATTLGQMQGDLKNVIVTKVNEVNSLASQIASLNDQIGRIVPHNYQPNDLYDQRDVLIDKLSKLVDVTVSNPNKKTGTVDISIGGVEFVSAGKAFELKIDPLESPINPQNITMIDPKDATVQPKTVNLTGGELLGRIESFGTTNGGVISDIWAKLDQFVETFTKAVNDVHKTGYDLKGNLSGLDFFTGTTAKDLAVNSSIMGSLDVIAASKKNGDDSVSSGNGENAKAIADIKFLPLDYKTATSTSDDFYRNIIGQLGIDSQEAQRMKDNSDVILQQVENRRQSVSGVSLDEEMSNMIRFQQAYNASARMVTAMDECLEKIINGMGRVGL